MDFLKPEDLFSELKSASEALHSAVTLLVDVDSTLLHVHTRNQATFRSFLTETDLGIQASQAQPALSTLEFLASDWGWEEPLRRAGLNLNPEAREAMQRYWQKHFFSGRFLHKDIEFKGAIEFLERLLKETDVGVIYLTARDETRMGVSTREDLALRRWPMSERATLWLKPEPHILDAEFKADAVARLRQERQGPLYLIDNEPTVLQAAAAHLPSDRLIWMDSVHSGVTPVNPTWRILRQWF